MQVPSEVAFRCLDPGRAPNVVLGSVSGLKPDSGGQIGVGSFHTNPIRLPQPYSSGMGAV